MFYALFMLLSLFANQYLIAGSAATLPPQSKLVFPGSSPMNGKAQTPKKFAADSQLNKTSTTISSPRMSFSQPTSASLAKGPSLVSKPNFQTNTPPVKPATPLVTSLQTQPTPTQIGSIGRLSAAQLNPFMAQQTPTTPTAPITPIVSGEVAPRKNVKELSKKPSVMFKSNVLSLMRAHVLTSARQSMKKKQIWLSVRKKLQPVKKNAHQVNAAKLIL
jgi:hypothetical protein